MPKRRRLLTPMKKKSTPNKYIMIDEDRGNKEVTTPRGRLKGALLDALEPIGEESDTSVDHTPFKRDRFTSLERRERRDTSDEDERPRRKRSPQRQSYVLKLFDRSVDLSQFDEDSPLYPICRAWITNQPKADYSKFGKKYLDPEPTDESVDLPGPVGPPVSRIPKLLPEQEQRSKDNIKLNYGVAPLPSREQLLSSHIERWTAVRQSWIEQSARVEARYEDAQQLLNRINVNAI